MVLERDHNMDLRFAAFVGFVLHNDAHYDFRILCARLRPLVLNNLQLFGLCEHPLHKYRPVPFRKSYPNVVVVQPGQEWNGDMAPERWRASVVVGSQRRRATKVLTRMVR